PAVLRVTPFRGSSLLRFGDEPFVDVAGVIVGGPRRIPFRRSDCRRLLRPALVHRRQYYIILPRAVMIRCSAYVRPMNQRRLFAASCVALVATAMTFAVRGDIMSDFERDFGLSKTDVGWIAGAAFWGFGLAILLSHRADFAASRRGCATPGATDRVSGGT